MTLNRWPWLNTRRIKPVHWRDIEILIFCCFDLDLWPWYSTLTWILWWPMSIPRVRSVGQLVWKLSTRNRNFSFFGCHDLDLGPMILILKFDLDIVMTCFCTKNEVNRSIGSKVIIWKQRQTHRQTHTHTQTHRHVWNLYLPALAGSNYGGKYVWQILCNKQEVMPCHVSSCWVSSDKWKSNCDV